MLIIKKDNALQTLKELENEINGYISYNGLHWQLKFSVNSIDIEKNFYTCFSEGAETQIFSRGGDFYFERNGEVEDITGTSVDDMYILLKDYMEENFDRINY